MPMEMPPVGPRAQKAYEALADELAATTPSQRTKMMGMPALKANGKMFLGLWGDAAVFKLTGDARAQALAIAGAALFDPSGQNRPMKEWVAVPVASSKRWLEFGRAAHDYVASATAT